MKLRKLIIVTWTFLLSFGAYAQFQDYLQGLQKDLQFKKTALADELSRTTNVKKMSFWDRLTSPDATALYSSIFNTIKLNDKLLAPNGDIKNARLIRGERYQTTPVITIFHEMGHAELDTLIENSSAPEDLAVLSLYKRVLKKRYRQHFSGARAYSIFHEHYAYYRTSALEYLYNELTNIYMNNGYNYIDKSCYLTPQLKELLASGISLDEFKKLRTFSEGPFYRKEIQLNYVFVKGKSFSLKEISDWGQIKDRVHLTFWSSLQKNYGFPINQKQFVERLNKSSNLKAFRRCRENLYSALDN